MKASRLNGIFGRTVGEILGAELGATLDDGAELGVSLGILPGSSGEFDRVVWLDVVSSLLGLKSCNIRPMKSVLSMPNKGSSIGHELLHTTHGFQYTLTVSPLLLSVNSWVQFNILR